MESIERISDVGIIGGGAAGMFAALIAARRGRSVILFEAGNILGKKLRITGKGRCNLTNNCTTGEVIENIPTGGKFLYSALGKLPPDKVIEYFENLGIPLKTERGRRVFPVSDDANQVAKTLEDEIQKAGGTIINTAVTKILKDENDGFRVKCGNSVYNCKNVIIATGGLSYPKTGSTGDGYKFAESFGHNVITPAPSLVPLVSTDSFCKEMQGLSLRNVKLTITNGGKKPVFSDFGELLFTHYGISGPLTLSASAHMRDYNKYQYKAVIDLKPALTDEMLKNRIIRDFDKNKNRDFANSLGDLVNRLMIPVIIRRSAIDGSKKVHSITREERNRLFNLLRSFDVSIKGPRPIDEAVITSGGVDTKEIQPATMESKLVPGLYFAGEVLNCDGYTGGYNLQIAWATAYAAGMAV